MQDADRLQEQVEELVAKAEVRAEVAKNHHQAVVKQRYAANKELAKFKFLSEVFTLGQNILAQRRPALLNGEQPPEAHVVEGLDAALDELGRILRQSQDAVQRFDGSQTALKGLEETFRDEEVQATSRARGLAVQGQRAVDVAAGRIEAPEEEQDKGVPEVAQAAEQVPGLVESIKKSAESEDSAKEPIGSPRQTAPFNGG